MVDTKSPARRNVIVGLIDRPSVLSPVETETELSRRNTASGYTWALRIALNSRAEIVALSRNRGV